MANDVSSLMVSLTDAGMWDLIAHQSLSTSAGIPVILEYTIYLVPYTR